MKVKEALIPKVYVEISGRDIPIEHVLELETNLDDIIHYDHDGIFHINEWERNMKDSLIELDLIECSHTSKYNGYSEYKVKSIKNIKTFFKDFWDVYNNIDRRQLRRERILSEMELDNPE